MRWSGLGALWLLGACGGGSDDKDTEDKPDPQTTQSTQDAADIVLVPGLLQYLELDPLETQDMAFTIRNVGGAPLEVSDLQLTGDAFELLEAETAFAIEPGGERQVLVRFSPKRTEDRGTVQVLSNDVDTPTAEVALIGYGLVASLDVTPSEFTFSDTLVGCADELELTLVNDGASDLEITAVTYDADPSFSLTSGPMLPHVIEPGDSARVTLQFAPIDTVEREAALEIQSNDPAGLVVVQQAGAGVYLPSVTETFTGPGVPPMDILILVDRSCSMESDNLDDVELGLPILVDGLAAVDWQIALVNDADGCALGGIATPAFPYVGEALALAAFSGPTPTYPSTEALLMLAEHALSKTGAGGCNEGLLRSGAVLQVIVLSDEREQSGQPAAYWVTEMEAYVSDPAMLRVSGVVDVNQQCGDGSGPGGYIDAINATGGNILNICNANWGANMGQLLATTASPGGSATYDLLQPAVAETLEVMINGVPATDVVLDAAGLLVTVSSPAVVDGDTVEVTYSPRPVCP